MHSLTPRISRLLKGFSLIEAAIVLGVVGLVIGGIWIAAASYGFERQKQQYFQGLLTLKVNAQRLIPRNQPCDPGNYLHYTAPELQAQLWPAEWTALGTLAAAGYNTTEFGRPSLQFVCDANNNTTLVANWDDWDPNFSLRACTLMRDYIYNRHDPDLYVNAVGCYSWAQGLGVSIILNH